MTNFDIFDAIPQFESFASVAVSAERILHIDASACVLNCRRAMEFAVKWMYSVDKALVMPYQDTLVSLMNTEDFRDIVGTDIWRRMDFIRRMGNNAAHTGKKITEEQAALCLENLYVFLDFVAYCYGENYTESHFDRSLLTQPAETPAAPAPEVPEADLASLMAENAALKEELTAIADKYGDDRKTEIQDVEDELDIEDLIEEEQCVFTLTENGYIKRTPVSEYAAQSKGGMGKKGITTRDEDYVCDVFTASTHDFILFFTDTGKVYRKKGYQIPESGKAAKGTALVNILQIETDERVQAMIHYRPNEETDESSLQLTMVTENGTVKRVAVSAFRNLRQNGIRALRLDEGDRLVSVLQTDGRSNILIATYDGMAVCFDENDVRSMGRDAVGVRGIRLREGDRVIGAACAVAGCQVLSITEHGFGKQTPVEEYRITNRGGIGIKNYMVTDKTGGVVGMKVVDGSEDLLLVTQSGIMLRTAVENIRSAGRATQGVIVMRFKEEGDQVIAMALTDKDEEE